MHETHSMVIAPAHPLSPCHAQPEHALPEHGQYLSFTLSDEIYALGILAIKEIIQYNTLTFVPMMPPFVQGVINLRGAVVPVIDLPSRFGRPASIVGRRTCIIIVEVTSDDGLQDVGLIADTVNEVIDIPRKDVEPPPAFGASIRSDFLLGLGTR